MEEHFSEIMDVDFTARMEDDLDRVEAGEVEWKKVVREFYPPLAVKIKEAEELIGEIEVKDAETDIICEHCGSNMVIKLGRFGKFLACPNFPNCRNTKPLFEEAGVNCPLCGGKVYIKKSKKGRTYYGCEHNPECAFLSWNKPTGDKCPECGEPLVIKGTRNRRIACSACNYQTELPEAGEDQEA
jgi:DNA topoisomerase-1